METSRFIEQLQKTSNTNVFVMMRYRSAIQFQQIEDAIRRVFSEFGLTALFAKDRALVEDLWENIQLYMRFSRYGVAVFEEIDEREFNPNISLELGYMYAHNRRCLLLKDRRMPRMPTDICGRIYRDFDVFSLEKSISEQVTAWCERDLGLVRIVAQPAEAAVEQDVLFDSAVDDPEFRTWGVFSTVRAFADHIRVQRDQSGRGLVLHLIANGNESVGVNKEFDQTRGKVRVEYQAIRSDAPNPNLLFCMIPMQEGNGRSELIEVGASTAAEPANAYSPYRQRYFVPHEENGDGRWHVAEIGFDFTKIPTASYSIFAPRVNEGCPRPGSGELLIRSVRMLSPRKEST